MPQLPEDPSSRTGEVPRIPEEAELRAEASPPAQPEAPDMRSVTGVHRLNVETDDDAPRDVDKPTPQKDSPA
jgi:hypothetical protein